MNPQQLKQLEQAATPGLWETDTAGVKEVSADYPLLSLGWTNDPEAKARMKADAALIVAMRNALPHLIELWEAAKELRELGRYPYPVDMPTLADKRDRLDAALARLDDAE